jgi:hypothetical protein
MTISRLGEDGRYQPVEAGAVAPMPQISGESRCFWSLTWLELAMPVGYMT